MIFFSCIKLFYDPLTLYTMFILCKAQCSSSASHNVHLYLGSWFLLIQNQCFGSACFCPVRIRINLRIRAKNSQHCYPNCSVLRVIIVAISRAASVPKFQMRKSSLLENNICRYALEERRCGYHDDPQPWNKWDMLTLVRYLLQNGAKPSINQVC